MAMDDATQEAALRQLGGSPGWLLLVETMGANLAVLANAIITKEQDGKALTDAEVDKLRDKHGYLTELMAMPDKLIGHLKKTVGDADDFDPFFKDVRQMRDG